MEISDSVAFVSYIERWYTLYSFLVIRDRKEKKKKEWRKEKERNKEGKKKRSKMDVFMDEFRDIEKR